MYLRAIKALFIVLTVLGNLSAAAAEDTYAVVQARVQGLEAKVRASEAEIQKLILEKRNTKDPDKVSEIIRTMLTLHKELGVQIKEYDQQRNLLKYRYPEKGLTDVREYERIDVKSLEDLETQVSLSASVHRTLDKVRMQYRSNPKRTISSEGEPLPADLSAQPPTQKSKSHFMEPIILKK